jgi:hypothetical protein
MVRFVFGSLVFLAFIGAATAMPLPDAVAMAALRTADCTLSHAEATKDLPPDRNLGDGLVLVEIPCWRAAYNFGSIFLAADPAAPAKARLLRFRVWDGKTFEERHSLTFPDYDHAERRMTSMHKGRGLGDCGSAGSWRWDGREFLLEAHWLKDDCDGELFDPFGEPDRFRVYPK